VLLCRLESYLILALLSLLVNLPMMDETSPDR